MGIKGSLDSAAPGEWYRGEAEADFRPDGEMFVRLEGEIDLKEDGSIWVRREQDGVKLVLMRAVAMPGRKLQTYTRQADGSEGRVVTRDSRK